MNPQAHVIGAGLAGCEAALLLADAGVAVTLYEQKPQRYSAAHTRPGYAELVCSNSLKAERLDSASGMLKAEMRLLGSHLLPVAERCGWLRAAPWQWIATPSARASAPWWRGTPASGSCTAR